MDRTRPFTPSPGATIQLAVGTVSAAVAIPGLAGSQIRVAPAGDCRVEFGDSKVAAVAPGAAAASPGSMMVKSGSVEVLTVPSGCNYIATIGASATTLEVTPGYGN